MGGIYYKHVWGMSGFCNALDILDSLPSFAGYISSLVIFALSINRYILYAKVF